jgi:hypothetical protein
MRRLYVLAGFAGLLATAACSHDVLSVQNPNSPDISRVLKKPADVESIIGSSFNTVWTVTVGVNTDGLTQQMMVMSFENASSLANYGMGPRVGIPRNSIDNSPGNAVAAGNSYDFFTVDRGARAASLGLVQLNSPGFTIGSANLNARARAFAFFTMGYANAVLALTYDSAAAVTETNSTVAFPPLLFHTALMDTALAQMDSSINEAGLMGTLTMPNTWIPSYTPGGPEFIRLVRSFKAHFRASIARSPAERAAVDWTKVRDDAVNGITGDVVMQLDPSKGWRYGWYVQHFLFDTWTQQTPMILGMADSAGLYDAYLATPLNSRSAFLIRSADKRLPSGDTRAAQQVYSGTGVVQTPGQGVPVGGSGALPYFRNRTANDPPSLAFLVSQYDWYREQDLYNKLQIGPFPLIQKAVVDLLAAEAYYRLGDLANAAARINITRVGNGQLPALPATMTTTSQVPGGTACVPRVPDPATGFKSTKCGTLFEALKWEKRMETAFMQYGAWYFDSRGWGDLAQGTPVEWPVPYQELQTRAQPIYNGTNQTTAVGTYGY